MNIVLAAILSHAGLNRLADNQVIIVLHGKNRLFQILIVLFYCFDWNIWQPDFLNHFLAQEIIKSFRCFRHGNLRIGLVHIIKVKTIHTQTLQTGFTTGHNIRIRKLFRPNLWGDKQRAAVKFADCPADQLLSLAVSIIFRRVNMAYPGFNSPANGSYIRCIVIRRIRHIPSAHHPCPQPEFRKTVAPHESFLLKY